MIQMKCRAVRLATGLTLMCLIVPALLVTVASLSLAVVAAGGPPEGVVRRPAVPAVLVELFTSEGCSSCPPADRLLSELASFQNGAKIIPLSFHVDYWNYLGWRDPYSSSEFSSRQRRYAAGLGNGGVYTPQLVVDGATSFVGSDKAKALSVIASAATSPKADLEIRAIVKAGEGAAKTIELEIEASGLSKEIGAGARPEVFLALTEDGLVSTVTRGENAGRRLEHTAVVRRLISLNHIDPSALPVFRKTVRLTLDENWKQDRLGAVVWIQNRRTRRVVAAARVAL